MLITTVPKQVILFLYGRALQTTPGSVTSAVLSAVLPVYGKEICRRNWDIHTTVPPVSPLSHGSPTYCLQNKYFWRLAVRFASPSTALFLLSLLFYEPLLCYPCPQFYSYCISTNDSLSFNLTVRVHPFQYLPIILLIGTQERERQMHWIGLLALIHSFLPLAIHKKKNHNFVHMFT